jgi:hypothetical protein
MPLTFPVLIMHSPVADLPRGFAKAQKKGGKFAVLHWHEKILPRHYRHGAEHKYGYKQRTAAYERRKKLRKSSRGRPHVYTALTVRQATRHAYYHGTATRATIDMVAPSYYTQRRKASNAPDLVKEVTTTLRSEAKAMAEIVTKTVHGEAMSRRTVVKRLAV